MSPLAPLADRPLEPPGSAPPAGRINHVIPTGALFAAALERLNRNSTVALLQQLTQEVDAHCRALGNAHPAGAPDGQLPGELPGLLFLLRQRVEQHHSELALVQGRLHELQAQCLQLECALEEKVSALCSRQLDQRLTPVLAALAQLEQSAAARAERELAQLGTRLTAELRARERAWRRRSCLLFLLLGLLAVAGAFALGRSSVRPSVPGTSQGAAAPWRTLPE